MTDSVVVDASVAVKSVVNESFTLQAQQLLKDVSLAHQLIYAPPHFLGESLNAIFQKFRSTDPLKHISEEELLEAVTKLLAFPFRVITPPNLYLEALQFVKAHQQVTLYDAMYVVLAQSLNLELWTADENLVSLVGSVAPWVRLISDYPLPEAVSASDQPEETTSEEESAQ